MASHAFLSGDGETGALMRARDWSGSPLGEPSAWPQSLRSVVGLMLTAKFPMFVAWGEELGLLYNDAYAAILGAKHPAALGARFRDVWGEIWPDISPLVDAALAGEATFRESLPLVMNRQGFDEQTWFTFSYSPVRDKSGAVAGVFCVCTETTGQVLAERALAAERDRAQGVLDGMAEGFALLDREFRILDVNAEAMRLETRPREAIVGRTHWEAYPGSEGSELGRLYKHAMAERAPVSLEHLYRWEDGREAWLEMRAYPVEQGLAVFYRDVSERRAAEAALRASTTRAEALGAEQAAILGQLAEGVIVTDPAGRITFVNEAAARIHGVAKLDVEPDAYSETYHLLTLDGEPYPPRELPLARAVRDGETVSDARWRVRRPDGSEVLAVGSARPVLDAAGGQIGAVLTLRDDTARDAAERMLRENEARLRLVQAAGGIGSFDYDLRKDEAVCSPEYFRLFGLPDGHPVNRETWAAVIHPDDQHKALAALDQAIAGRVPFDYEYRIVRADTGEVRWLSGRAAVLFDAQDRPWRYVGGNVDVTDRRRAEERLRELNDTLERQVEERTAERDRIWTLMPDLLMTGSLDGRLLSVNPAWTQVLGYDEATLLSRPFWEVIHPDFLAASGEAVREMKEGRTARHQNQVRTASGGYRWFDWVSTPVGELFYAVARDITDEKVREAELASAQDALRQAQKMEAVGQLTGGLAHDFNNLLAGISGSLELMGNRIAQGRLADVERYLVAAQGAAKRAAALTHRLLAFSRRQTLEPKPTDVNRLVAGMEELIRRTVGPAIEVEAVAKAGLWPTLVDPHQLENALLNLCINARDAMPEGGKIIIETGNRWLDERGARERDLAPGQYVSLCVSDNGTGMTREVRVRAFDPFFTTKPLGEGTGLGLSMVYGFARQSGGQVRIYSELGQGTMVCLYLPRHHAPEAAEALAPAEQATPAGAGAGETVLVVDDEPTVRMLVADVVGELGFRAIEAGTGPEGLEVIRSDQRVDLLVTDVGLPGGLNGRQVADAARGLRPGLRVLFITGYAENAVLSHGHLGPGMAVVTKPFDMARLAGRIREMVSDR